MHLPSCIRLCWEIRRTIYFNIAFAVFVKIIAIALAISGAHNIYSLLFCLDRNVKVYIFVSKSNLGMLPLWAAILIDMGSLLVVIISSMLPALRADTVWKTHDDKFELSDIVVETNTTPESIVESKGLNSNTYKAVQSEPPNCFEINIPSTALITVADPPTVPTLNDTRPITMSSNDIEIVNDSSKLAESKDGITHYEPKKVVSSSPLSSCSKGKGG